MRIWVTNIFNSRFLLINTKVLGLSWCDIFLMEVLLFRKQTDKLRHIAWVPQAFNFSLSILNRPESVFYIIIQYSPWNSWIWGDSAHRSHDSAPFLSEYIRRSQAWIFIAVKDKLPFLIIFCSSLFEVTVPVNFPKTGLIYQNIYKKMTQM